MGIITKYSFVSVFAYFGVLYKIKVRYLFVPTLFFNLRLELNSKKRPVDVLLPGALSGKEETAI